ncbi:LytTR family transcriptional regulator DNA-binding domain-containing protein [Spirosoma pomorum]
MRRIELIKLAQTITHLSGEANYTRVHFTNHKDLLLCRTVSQCQQELPDFIRIHKRYLINPSFVSKAVVTDARSAHVLIRDHPLPISRRRLKDVLEAIWMAKNV